MSIDGSLSVRVNGEHRRVPGGTSVAEMVNLLGLDPLRVAVERNLEVIPRSTLAQVCVADGTDLAAQKIERVLTNDPGMGVIRHGDAGYDRAVEVAEERGVRIPMRS